MCVTRINRFPLMYNHDDNDPLYVDHNSLKHKDITEHTNQGI